MCIFQLISAQGLIFHPGESCRPICVWPEAQFCLPTMTPWMTLSQGLQYCANNLVHLDWTLFWSKWTLRGTCWNCFKEKKKFEGRKGSQEKGNIIWNRFFEVCFVRMKNGGVLWQYDEATPKGQTIQCQLILLAFNMPNFLMLHIHLYASFWAIFINTAQVER